MMRMDNSIWSEKIRWFAVGLLIISILYFIEDILSLDIEYRTSYFFLCAVAVVAWKTADVMLALAMGVLSAGAWLLAKEWFSGGFATHSILLWNGLTIGGYFLIIGFLIAKWRETVKRLAALSAVDPLTGALNTREFSVQLDKEITRANRYGRPFSVAYFDLDDFKAVNDRFGHGLGDFLLRQVTDAIRSSVRSSDMIGRLGGDEFAVLFPETSQSSVQQVIGKILPRFESCCRLEGRQVTFSAGVVTCHGDVPSREQLMNRLDRLMYDAKKRGQELSGIRFLGEWKQWRPIWTEPRVAPFF